MIVRYESRLQESGHRPVRVIDYNAEGDWSRDAIGAR
jgi:hypothetical protein